MKETSRETVYHEVFIYNESHSIQKTCHDGTVMVDNKAFYVGEHGNFRYPWKNVVDVELNGRESLTIKCKDDIMVECLQNSDDAFQPFAAFVMKQWNKKQGKKEAKMAAATETTSWKRPAKKHRRSYGGRSTRTSFSSKPHVSMTQHQASYFSSDDEEKQEKSWDEPQEPQEVLTVDEDAEDELNDDAENKFNDGYDDENQTPNVKNTTKKLANGKRRLQPKKTTVDDIESDDDDNVFGDAALTTPASKRLVSPANLQDSDDDEDEEATHSTEQHKQQQPDPATTGNQSITNFFSAKIAPNKTATKPPKKQPETSVARAPKSPATPSRPKPSPFSISKGPCSTPTRPLKQNSTDWLKNRRTPYSSPKRVSQSRFFPVSAKRDDYSDDDEQVDSPSASPAPPQVSGGLFSSSNKKRAAVDDDEIENASPRVLHPRQTSGVDRRRFLTRRVPLQTSPKRTLADAALSETPVKKIRFLKNRPSLSLENRISKPMQVSPTPSSPWRGLRNLGNTCYLNSSLQMLFSVPTFVSSLAGQGKDLAKSIVSVSKDITDTTQVRAANPNAVKKAVDAVTDKFQGYEQRDAHEFLSDLVDRVHDELEEEQNERGREMTDGAPPFPTDEYFRMNVEVCLTCDSCGYARTMKEMYRHLSIDVEDENKPPNGAQDENLPPWTVQRGLDQFFAPETREIRCEKCANGTTATQTLRILSRPKALLLHLKRFVLVEKPIAQQVTVSESNHDAGENAEAPKRKAAVEMAIRKNKAPVILNRTISLGPIVSSDKSKESDSGDSMATYDVKSVSHHIGGTAWSGHYTCDAIRERDPKATSPTKEPDETWVSFDDGLTSATTADQVLNSEKSKKTAYMLLYTLHA